jgi:peptidoglycan hydrolase-like protein with peptidoglycan-binding domain
MKPGKLTSMSVVLLSSLSFSAVGLLAQSPTAPSTPRPGPEAPGPTAPTIPGQPAPGLPPTDPVPGGPGTIPEQIKPPPSKDMVISAEDIKKAQEALKAKGFDPGPPTGKMEGRTQEALTQFQRANGLPPTGVLDDKTAGKLGVTLSGGKRADPKPKEDTKSKVP